MTKNFLGPPVGLTDLLDYEIHEKLKTEKENKSRGIGSYHPLRPSSAGACARKLAYDLMEHRGYARYDFPLIEPNIWRLFELGHVVEHHSLKNFQLVKIFQQKYKQQQLTFFELERGIEGVSKEIVEGSCDFVLWSDKYKAVGDVKSKKDKFAAAYKTHWDEETAQFAGMSSLLSISPTCFYADDLDAFLDELGGDDWLAPNLYQVNLYAHAEFLVQRGVEYGFLYQYNKNDSRHREIRFRPSRPAFDYVREKFNTVCKAVDAQKPEAVEKEYFLGSMKCAFCAAKGLCWDEDAMKAFYSKEPKAWPKDLQWVDPSGLLEGKIKLLEEYRAQQEEAKLLETDIATLMEGRKFNKVRLSNGRVYELKYLKTPHPHFEIRASKA